MTSIAYLVPATGIDEGELRRRERVAGELVRADVRVLEASVLSIDHGSEELVERMAAAGRAAVEEAGAGAVVPGCMSLAFMRVHDAVREEIGVPFVDPVAVSLETAETWARHGIAPSRADYPPAPRSKLDGLLGGEGQS